MEEEEKYLFDAKKLHFKPHINHVCSIKKCNPENETTLIEKGLCKLPYYTNDNIYVCDYGDIHVCSEYTCLNIETCPVSGKSMGYIQDMRDPFVPTTTTKKRKAVDLDQVYERIRDLVERLLFSDVREKINQSWYKKQMTFCKKEQNNYIQDVGEQYPVNMIGLLQIQNKYLDQSFPLEILQRDEQKIVEYSHLIIQMYENIQKYSSQKVCIESIVLAVLYTMRTGLILNGVTVLASDDYLKHLPLMNDLPKFQIDKKKYTVGVQFIQFLIQYTHSNSIPLENVVPIATKQETIQYFLPSSRKKKL